MSLIRTLPIGLAAVAALAACGGADDPAIVVAFNDSGEVVVRYPDETGHVEEQATIFTRDDLSPREVEEVEDEPEFEQLSDSHEFVASLG